MKKTNNETEIPRLKGELSDANKHIKNLSKNLEKVLATSAKGLLKNKEKICIYHPKTTPPFTRKVYHL